MFTYTQFKKHKSSCGQVEWIKAGTLLQFYSYVLRYVDI